METTLYLLAAKIMKKSLILFSGAFICLATQSCGQEAVDHTAQKAVNNLSVKTVTMPVEGMSCGSCVSTVKKTVRALDGVQGVEVSLEKREATITYSDDKITPQQIGKAISDKGYKTGEAVEVKTP